MSIQRQQRDNSPFEQPPYMFPQDDPYMSEMTPPGSTRHRSTSSSVAFSDESLPPSHRRTASMPVRPYPMQPLFYPSQPPLSSEYLHLAQLDSLSHSQSRGQNFAPPLRQLPMSPAYLTPHNSTANHQPFSRPSPTYSSSNDSFGIIRRPGVAPLQGHSRASSSGEWNINEDMPSPGSSRVGSDSFSGPVSFHLSFRLVRKRLNSSTDTLDRCSLLHLWLRARAVSLPFNRNQSSTIALSSKVTTR